ncbi:putative RNA-directed DNA polymerase from transposon X-element [Araneus ventricosus]|uniref:Putative RNA-directed DNA polymerase from transposon X-element n=1 Tax=Araneus ventricosus TaxID=182803 RepID=A0A4Y2SJ81_ARAVE|nr:putative RNA-directed DNA polymerase from transposon X-element [Araneus ventricosus]
MQKFCRKNKINFYVIRPPSERPFKIVIKGVHPDTETDEIKKELEIAVPEIKIIKISSMKNIRSKKPMPMYMVELKKNGKEEKIFDLSRFMYFTETVENYRKPPGATQCWNCNQFNHSSANCGYTTRCLKCGQEHRTSECTITTPQDNPTCINCGVVGHLTSWRGCPAFPKIKPTKGQGVNYPRTQREFFSSQYKRQENIPYAQQVQKFLPRPDKLHESRNNTPHPTGNGECIEQEFYGFLQGIKVMYDGLKSIPNLIKSVSELTQLSTTEDRINHVIKALSSVANARQGTGQIRTGCRNRNTCPPSPTRFGYNSATILDLALIKDFILPYEITSLPELYSDHKPIKLTFKLKFSTPHDKITSNTDWSKFQNYLRNHVEYKPYRISNEMDIEEAVCNFEKNLQNAHRFATKIVKNSTSTYIHPNIKDLIKTRNKTKKDSQTLRNPSIKTELNRIEKLIKKLEKESRQKDKTEELETLNPENGTLWTKAKIMRRKAQKIPALKGEFKLALSDPDKAETIELSLEKQFSLNNLSHSETEEEVNQSTNNFSPPINNNYQNDNINSIQPSEFIKIIKKLNIKKACGRDGITNKMIKNIPCTMVFALTEIINNIFNFNYFPNAWKTAVVVPILKPGKDPTIPENYRPISLLSTLSKITENFILDKLNKHLIGNKILCPEQFGFRNSLTTNHQLLRVVEYITKGFDRGEYTAAVFLDIQKAFDRVWKQGLIHKLIMYKTPPNLDQLLNFYLDDRKFVVRVGNSSSESKTMKAGIPQGGKISPVLYSIHVNDIPTTHKTLLGMYADDTAILARNKNPKYTAAAINQHLEKLDDWFVKWKIALNVSKTEAVCFAKGEKKHKPVIKIKNKIIPWSQQAKYLGIILDKKLTWQSHISSIKTKFRNATRKLYPLIARDSDMKRKYKILIYTAILRPIITHGCPIWGAAAKSNINKLEVLENNIIRQICKAGWYMRNEDIRKAIKLPSLKDLIKKISVNFYNNIENIDKEAIQQIDKYTPNFKSKRPRKILL